MEMWNRQKPDSTKNDFAEKLFANYYGVIAKRKALPDNFPFFVKVTSELYPFWEKRRQEKLTIRVAQSGRGNLGKSAKHDVDHGDFGYRFARVQYS